MKSVTVGGFMFGLERSFRFSFERFYTYVGHHDWELEFGPLRVAYCPKGW